VWRKQQQLIPTLLPSLLHLPSCINATQSQHWFEEVCYNSRLSDLLLSQFYNYIPVVLIQFPGVLSAIMLLLVLLWFFVQMACAYHAAKSAHAQVADPAPGQIFSIGGGVHMHMICQGQTSNGSVPTIIFESMEVVGQALAWAAVFEEMKDDVRACSYDRRGYGWSSPLPFANSDTQKRSINDTVRFCLPTM
jgi:hypothetical protein